MASELGLEALDIEALKRQHKGWVMDMYASKGQREDSNTILTLIARIEELEAGVKAAIEKLDKY